jgi:alpha-1,2-mannosyltransferase
MSVATQRDRSLLVYGGFALSLAVVIVVCRPWNLTDHIMIGAPFGRDYVNFWMGGRLALEGRLDLLVDLRAYNALIADKFSHWNDDFFIFSYPPTLLPFLVPFGAMPYVPSLLVWTAVNFALLAWSARLIERDRWPAIAACLSPAAVMMVTYGHFSGVLAALATVAVTRGRARPLLAGMCLALISVKPQFAALLGIVMVLAGQWRAVAWSVPGAAGLIGLSILLFGIAPWRGFFEVTVPFHSWLIREYVVDHLRNTLSLYAAARLEGLSFAAAQTLQAGFSLAVVAGSGLLVLRDGLNPRTLTLLLLAALAALPYFQPHDLVIAIPALAVALFGGQAADQRPLLPFVPAVLLWLSPSTSIPFGIAHWPIVNLIVAGALITGLVREWRSGGAPRNLAVRPVTADRH